MIVSIRLWQRLSGHEKTALKEQGKALCLRDRGFTSWALWAEVFSQVNCIIWVVGFDSRPVWTAILRVVPAWLVVSPWCWLRPHSLESRAHGMKQEIGGGKFIGLEGVQEEPWVLGKAFRETSGQRRKQWLTAISKSISLFGPVASLMELPRNW